MMQIMPQAGNVITCVSKWGFNPIKWIVYWSIQRWQKKFFGTNYYCESTHVMLCTGENELFEVTGPKSRFTNFDCLEKFKSYRIYRYAHRRLDSQDLTILRETAQTIANNRYDYLDLLDFLVYEILGYPKANTEIFTGIFGLGKEHLVCSTGVAVIWRCWQDTLHPDLPKLFAGTPVELTSPSHFDNYPSDFVKVSNGS